MPGAHAYVISEITKKMDGKKGKEYLKLVEEEFDGIADEGAEKPAEEPQK
jgi:hypothetical protein